METSVPRDDRIVRCFASDCEFVSQTRNVMYDLNVRRIMEILPHRSPFLFVDRIVELYPHERIVGYKNVTFNEPVLRGHFPGNPVFPEVYIIEALAQLAGCIVLEPGQFWKNPPYFTGIDKAKFLRRVVPGDRLMMDVRMRGRRRNVFWMSGVARVDDEIACAADLNFVVTRRKIRASHPLSEHLD
jgi:3-hydroxyacyl-[acyl-carrier-protein] dehydratase